MAQGIWATWYDLPAVDEARERVLAWTHDTYCPWLRVQPGYIWVAHYRYTVSVRESRIDAELRDEDC